MSVVESLLVTAPQGQSWISAHGLHDRAHELTFLAHDIGIILFGVCALMQLLSLLDHSTRRLHRWSGTILLTILCPLLLVSGFSLCDKVSPPQDAIIFQTYGLFFGVVWLRQCFITWYLHRNPFHTGAKRPSALVVNTLWGVSTDMVLTVAQLKTARRCFQAHADMCHTTRYMDLLYVMGGMPGIILASPTLPLPSCRSWWVREHRLTGVTLWYLGALGTVFSLTQHPWPLEKHSWARQYVYTTLHLVFAVTFLLVRQLRV